MTVNNLLTFTKYLLKLSAALGAEAIISQWATRTLAKDLLQFDSSIFSAILRVVISGFKLASTETSMDQEAPCQHHRDITKLRAVILNRGGPMARGLLELGEHIQALTAAIKSEEEVDVLRTSDEEPVSFSVRDSVLPASYLNADVLRCAIVRKRGLVISESGSLPTRGYHRDEHELRT